MFERWKKPSNAVPEAGVWRQNITLPICCFCGDDIDPIETDPLTVRVTTRQGQWQAWFSHATCCKTEVAIDAPVDLSPVHF